MKIHGIEISDKVIRVFEREESNRERIGLLEKELKMLRDTIGCGQVLKNDRSEEIESENVPKRKKVKVLDSVRVTNGKMVDEKPENEEVGYEIEDDKVEAVMGVAEEVVVEAENEEEEDVRGAESPATTNYRLT